MFKISYNENFEYIVNYIKTTDKKINYYDLIDFVCDNKSYKELYLNWHIFKDLIQYHNEIIDNQSE